MDVTYFAKYSSIGPSSRYRAYQFQDPFAKEGINLRIQPLFDNAYFEFLRDDSTLSQKVRKSMYVAARFNERRKALRTKRANLTIIEQQLFPYLPFVIEKQILPDHFLLEMDDAIYLMHPNKMPRLIAQAMGILVGNEFLAEYARVHNGNVHVIPTVLNTDLFRPGKKSSSGKIRIGWSGLEYNFKYLRFLQPVFHKLLSSHSIEIVILSGSSPQDLEFPFRFEKWDPVREVDQMQEFDIGVMPLEMDEWSRGKCGMKLLQYMSLGIPAVATPVGVNSTIIQEGKNGCTALSVAEWTEKLSQLVTDTDLRSRLGKAARATVVESYSVQAWFPKLLEIYSSYASSR